MLPRYVEYGADAAKVLNDSQNDQITDKDPKEFLRKSETKGCL